LYLIAIFISIRRAGEIIDQRVHSIIISFRHKLMRKALADVVLALAVGTGIRSCAEFGVGYKNAKAYPAVQARDIF
jgi:hypothetical protein